MVGPSVANTNWATPDQLAQLRNWARPKRTIRHPERYFTDDVKRYARRGGWLPFHTLHAKGSDPGFPDLILLRVPRLVVAELKIPPNTTSDWQDCWLAGFASLGLLSGPHLSIETYLWTPADWPEIERVLT